MQTGSCGVYNIRSVELAQQHCNTASRFRKCRLFTINKWMFLFIHKLKLAKSFETSLETCSCALLKPALASRSVGCGFVEDFKRTNIPMRSVLSISERSEKVNFQEIQAWTRSQPTATRARRDLRLGSQAHWDTAFIQKDIIYFCSANVTQIK